MVGEQKNSLNGLWSRWGSSHVGLKIIDFFFLRKTLISFSLIDVFKFVVLRNRRGHWLWLPFFSFKNGCNCHQQLLCICAQHLRLSLRVASSAECLICPLSKLFPNSAALYRYAIDVFQRDHHLLRTRKRQKHFNIFLLRPWNISSVRQFPGHRFFGQTFVPSVHLSVLSPTEPQLSERVQPPSPSNDSWTQF